MCIAVNLLFFCLSDRWQYLPKRMRRNNNLNQFNDTFTLLDDLLSRRFHSRPKAEHEPKQRIF